MTYTKWPRRRDGAQEVSDAWQKRALKAEADHKAAEQNVSDLMAEVAQTGSLLMKAEAELAALRLELARLDGEIPYGN